ncbi:MAG: DUF2254 domain-containing protein [Cumulibacter sp.]
MYRWWTQFRAATRFVGFRATVFSLCAIGIAAVAWLVSLIAPSGFGWEIGQDAVSTILQILASSMLAVTTFSLTTMVSAYSAASTSGTPRSTQLLILDRTSQNALSTFIGAFAYSIVGIIALAMKILSDAGVVVLFLGTLLVVVTMLVTLLRWISFLTKFGRVSDITDRVERAATQSMSAYVEAPTLGAAPWSSLDIDARPIAATADGYVTDLHIAYLHAIAEKNAVDVWVMARPGATVSGGEALVYVTGKPDAEFDDAVRKCFGIGAHRTFDNDPRLGPIALSEVASKALSTGINDPGTAIDVMRATERVLRLAQSTAVESDVRFPRIRVREICAQDFVTDGLRPIARDGASTVEVSVRMQREMARLLENAPDADWAAALRSERADALARSESAMAFAGDIVEVRESHADTA